MMDADKNSLKITHCLESAESGHLGHTATSTFIASPSLELLPSLSTRASNNTKVREDFTTITENARTRAFSWLKAPISAFIFKTLLRQAVPYDLCVGVPMQCHVLVG